MSASIFAFPAEHRRHPRTSNLIESPEAEFEAPARTIELMRRLVAERAAAM